MRSFQRMEVYSVKEQKWKKDLARSHHVQVHAICHKNLTYNLIADQEEATLKQPEQDVKEETNVPIIIFVVFVLFMVFILSVVGMLFRVNKLGLS